MTKGAIINTKMAVTALDVKWFQLRCAAPGHIKGQSDFLSTPPLGQPQEQSLPENLFKRSRQIVSPPDANFKGSPTKKADGIYPLQGVGGRGESGQNGMPSAT